MGSFMLGTELVLLGAMPLVVIGLSDTSVMFEAAIMVGGESMQRIRQGGHVEDWNMYVWRSISKHRMT